MDRAGTSNVPFDHPCPLMISDTGEETAIDPHPTPSCGIPVPHPAPNCGTERAFSTHRLTSVCPQTLLQSRLAQHFRLRLHLTAVAAAAHNPKLSCGTHSPFPTHVKTLLEGGELPFEREEIEGAVDGFALPSAAEVFVVQIQRVEAKASVAQLHLRIVAEYWRRRGEE